MKILLTYSASDIGYYNFEMVPPIGVISLVSVLPEKVKEKTHFLDANILSTENVKEWIKKEKPDIVGISALTYGYKSAIEIGKTAKENNAIVVLGGTHATNATLQIYNKMLLSQRPFDHLIYGFGEYGFLGLVNDYERFGGISYRTRDFIGNILQKETRIEEILKNVEKRGNYHFERVYDDKQAFDYSILREANAPSKYGVKLKKIGKLSQASISMPIMTQIGCDQACKFCCIPKGIVKIPDNVFEKSLENLLTQTNADHIWLTDPNLFTSYEHVNNVVKIVKDVKEKTGKDPAAWYLFSRADRLLEKKNVDLLDELGNISVLLGYESGSDKILKLMRKHETKKDMLKATYNLAEKGIEIISATFVLGTPGETRKTLEETIQFTRQLSQIGNIKSLLSQPVYPLPGSPYFKEFIQALSQVNPALADELKVNDIFEMNLLMPLFQEVAHLMPKGGKYEERPSYSELIDAREEMFKIIPKGVEFSDIKNDYS
ncbi:B12-binding domain-containing radical SAM protein [Candidatus Woesearchaeota archaeon]|nr:B12-binding domain-containing radical SAM protein [Candidatus Woesearchaeota archaeon]